MRKTKTIFTALLILAMVTAMLAGCAASKQSESQATTAAADVSTASAAPDPMATHLDISVAMWSIGQAFPEGGEDPVRDYIYNKLNITIKPMNVTWDDYTQKIQVWSASDQLPDLWVMDAVTRTNFTQWINQGVIKEIPKDLSAYPNLQELMNSAASMITYPSGDPNGKFYCIPRGSYKNIAYNGIAQGMLIRKDWMNAAGITAKPENMDQFKELLRAYVKQGKVGLTCYNSSWLSVLMYPYEPGCGMQNSYRWIRQDGKWVPAFMSTHVLEGLKNIQSLLKEGLLDQDFALFKADEGENKFASGKAGALAGSTDLGGIKGLLQLKYDALNPNSNWEDTFDWIGTFPSPDDNRYADTGPGFWSESYINSKCDDVKTDRILRMFEFWLSEEGVRLLKDGIEGVDYTENADGTITLLETKDAKGNVYTDLSQKYPACTLTYFAQWAGDNYFDDPRQKKIVDFMKPRFDWVVANTSNKFTDYRIDLFQYPGKDKLTADFQVDMTQAVLSSDIDAAWAKIVQNHLNNGYDKIIEEVNALASKSGIK